MKKQKSKQSSVSHAQELFLSCPVYSKNYKKNTDPYFYYKLFEFFDQWLFDYNGFNSKKTFEEPSGINCLKRYSVNETRKSWQERIDDPSPYIETNFEFFYEAPGIDTPYWNFSFYGYVFREKVLCNLSITGSNWKDSKIQVSLSTKPDGPWEEILIRSFALAK